MGVGASRLWVWESAAMFRLMEEVVCKRIRTGAVAEGPKQEGGTWPCMLEGV